MSCYFIAEINIHDAQGYEKYLEGVDEAVAKYNGKYLAADESPETLEGKKAEGRIVIIEFTDEKTLKEWYNSPEYRNILKYRLSLSGMQDRHSKGQII